MIQLAFHYTSSLNQLLLLFPERAPVLCFLTFFSDLFCPYVDTLHRNQH